VLTRYRIPIIALVVFFFLHRRYKKQLVMEDRKDAEKYKSMDFGMDLNADWGKKSGKKSKRGDPEMAKTYQPRQMKGLSLDPSHSPFFLNNDSNGKDSDSRSVFEDEDRYNLVKVMDPNSRSNSRANSRAGTPATQRPQLNRVATNSSMSSSRFDSNSRFQSNSQFDSSSQLVSNAQAPAMSPPPRGESLRTRGESASPPATSPRNYQLPEFNMQYSPGPYEKPLPPPQPEPVKFKDDGLMVPKNEDPRDSYFDKNAATLRNSNNYLNAFFTEKADGDRANTYETFPGVDSTSSTAVDTRNNSLNTYGSSATVDPLPPTLPPMPLDFTDAPSDAFASAYDQPRQFGNPPTHASVAKQVPDFGDEEQLEYPPRHMSFQGSMHFTPSFVSDKSNLTDILRTPRDSGSTLPPVPALPAIPARGESLAAAVPIINEPAHEYLDMEDAYMTNGGRYDDNNRLSVLMRPLPPDDPQDANPEERANRIRSFYKEYFDDGNPKPFGSTVPLPPQPQYTQQYQDDYYEDYTSEYQGGGTLYDPEQNGFVVANAPFAEPVTRRAMTPPPRAPPRFQHQGPPQARGRMRSSSNSYQNGPQMFPPRGASAMSNQYPPPPRGQSAMSHRNRHQQFKKALPPPKTLASLPTPHMLRDDAAIFGAADFAPPVSFRERQNGRRPDSPLGVQRPYSPAVKPFVPLNSSFEELAHVPSP
jgi:hypothetical protein